VENRDLARIYQKALAGEGYCVSVVHDGEQALEFVAGDPPDALLLDVTLPRRDGFEVLQSLRTRHDESGQIPVVLLSNCRITPQYRERAASLFAEAFLAKPVPLDHLLSEIAGLLKSPPLRIGSEPRGQKKQTPRKGAGTAPMEGSFEELPLPQLLHHLHGLRASGVLLLSSGKKRKAVQLRDGYPVAVKSNLVDECLGNLLMSRGRLDRDQFSESLARMKQGEGSQGEILVAMQILDEAEIAGVLCQQAHEKIFEIFEWKVGRFKLERGKRLQGGNALPAECSPAELILEGVRKRFPLSVVDRHLKQSGAKFVTQATSPFYAFQDIELSPEESDLVRSLDGSRPLSALVGGADERVRRTLYALLMTGLLELESAPQQPARPRPGPKKSAPTARPEPKRRPAVRAESAIQGDDRSLRAELAARAQRLRQQNYYEMLGVDRFCGEDQLRIAYEDLARRTHPDRYHRSSSSVRQLADEAYELVGTAYETLLDPKRRLAYDVELREDQRRLAKEKEGRRALAAETEFQKGESLARRREYELALMHFGKAVEHNPEEGEYHAHYGWCLHLIHPDDTVMIGEAIEHVRRGIKLARDHEKPYLFLGRLYKAMGRSDAAEKMFAHVVRIRPDSVEAMRELRLLNMRREKNKGLIGRLFRR
jgi:CheY-like chemotaxis protein